ncbi:hypothetical protein Gotri_003861 [Gossypium trilobum]|uniref:Uncharacterized protein n=1 Tax=Gossypium trilobum TaxID=34281 RepID=A0A7J9F2Y1_9ROSI|nr:hypothetical protein [Gossypium trilobum]
MMSLLMILMLSKMLLMMIMKLNSLSFLLESLGWPR